MRKRLIVSGAALVAALGAVWCVGDREDEALFQAAALGMMVEQARQEAARFSTQCPVAWQLCDQTDRCWCPRD